MQKNIMYFKLLAFHVVVWTEQEKVSCNFTGGLYTDMEGAILLPLRRLQGTS